MKLSISRAQHARLVAGLSPVERSRLDELVDVHDGEPPQLIDGARIAGRFAELVAEQATPRPPAILGATPTSFTLFDEMRDWARQGGKTALIRAAAAAAEAGEQVTVASHTSGQAWTAPSPSPWLDMDDVIKDLVDQEVLRDSDQRTRLDWLTDREPSDMLADLRELGRQVHDRLPPARELRVGQRARDALRAVATERTDYIPAGYTPGVPIVVDPELPAGGWQIVDVDSGKVLFEGHIGPTVDDYREAVRPVVDELADRAGIPRDVLY